MFQVMFAGDVSVLLGVESELWEKKRVVVLEPTSPFLWPKWMARVLRCLVRGGGPVIVEEEEHST